MSQPVMPPQLKSAAAFNVVFAFLYLMLGAMLASVVPGVASNIVLACGLSAFVGSLGMMFGRRWALRYAIIGLTVLALHNVLISGTMLLMAMDNAIGLPLGLLYSVGTLLQIHTLMIFRRPESAEYLWAVTESELDGEMELLAPQPLESPHSDVVELDIEEEHDEVELHVEKARAEASQQR